MTKIANRTVLITGGAAGIGKLLAQKCLEENAYQLILWDIDKEALAQTKAEFEADGHDVATYIVDVSDLDAIQTAAEAVKDAHGTVDILFNNQLVFSKLLRLTLLANLYK